MDKDLVRLSKRMSYVLRHAPHTAGLTLDPQGWVEVPVLLTALRLSREQLDAVVAGNDKKRFAIETAPDGREMIRASQGHSVDVDLGLPPATPPGVLYHGTPATNLPSIEVEGLRKGGRQHVHLSLDVATANVVGHRRRPAEVAILAVDAAGMSAAGYAFYVSANGVWLTDAVPPTFISRHS